MEIVLVDVDYGTTIPREPIENEQVGVEQGEVEEKAEGDQCNSV